MKMDVTREADLAVFAARVATKILPGTVIGLQGDLGAGKTTWTRYFLQALGVRGSVKSPTYTIVESYPCAQFTVFHFDWYRLRQESELWELGFEEYCRAETVCVIEWPERFDVCAFDIMISFILQTTERFVVIKAVSERGEEIIKNIISTS